MQISYVFPSELSSVPLVRDIDFTINLVPGVESISRNPYRIGPTILKELKEKIYARKKGGCLCFKELRRHELNYSTHDLELAAIVFVLKKRRHYLYGAQFEIFTDHNSLHHIFS